MQAHGDYWWHMDINAGTWRSLVAYGDHWWHMEINAGTWRSLVAYGDRWSFDVYTGKDKDAPVATMTHDIGYKIVMKLMQNYLHKHHNNDAVQSCTSQTCRLSVSSKRTKSLQDVQKATYPSKRKPPQNDVMTFDKPMPER